jgi:glyceraldehyde 3-phosphate dehydrogenase
MAIRIGLMGFGRIGRYIFRILYKRDDVEVAAISDIAEPKGLEYLLRFDTVLGRFPHKVEIEDGRLQVLDKTIPFLSGREPGDVNWKKYGVETVVEATGRYRSVADVSRHLDVGASRVIMCVPPVDEPDFTCVLGVNEDRLSPKHRVISNASCTAHAVAPIAKILNREFGIRRGFLTAVHAYTNRQRLADVPSGDMRASRSAAENVFPTETRAHELVMKLIPDLAGKLGGMAMSVPVPDGSIVDLVLQTERKSGVQEVNEAVRKAAATELAGLIQYETNPIVSSDVIGNSHSGIFDSLGTQALGDDLVKVLCWFDNGCGYANRVVELVKKLDALPVEARP